MAGDRLARFRRRWRTAMTAVGAALLAVGLFGLALEDDGGGAVVGIASVADLQAHYDAIGYTLEGVGAGGRVVPRAHLAGFPSDWPADLTPDVRKHLFFRAMLPLVLEVNETILAERRRLLAYRRALAAGAIPDADDTRWVTDLAGRYGTRDAGAPETLGTRLAGWLGGAARTLDLVDAPAPPAEAELRQLEMRVDAVPVSLALAQAALESAYGTSRFAVEGNALYGQWSYAQGMVPGAQRAHLGDYRVAAFLSPLASVAAYAANLNTHPAYRGFRALRARLRGQGAPLDGLALADTLGLYAEEGRRYIESVRLIIRVNGLTRLDAAEFDGGPPVRLEPVSRRLGWRPRPVTLA